MNSFTSICFKNNIRNIFIRNRLDSLNSYTNMLYILPYLLRSIRFIKFPFDFRWNFIFLLKLIIWRKVCSCNLIQALHIGTDQFLQVIWLPLFFFLYQFFYFYPPLSAFYLLDVQSGFPVSKYNFISGKNDEWSWFDSSIFLDPKHSMSLSNEV